MPFWSRLYNTVWLVFFTCVMIPRWMTGDAAAAEHSIVGLGIPRWLAMGFGPAVHLLLGLGVVLLTRANAQRLASMPVPARLQRVSKVSANLAVFMAVCGVALGAVTHVAPNLPVVGAALRALHVVCALAILAQVSSVATGHDMWEEKELGGPASPNATPQG